MKPSRLLTAALLFAASGSGVAAPAAAAPCSAMHEPDAAPPAPMMDDEGDM